MIFTNIEFNDAQKERIRQLAVPDEVRFGNPEVPIHADKKDFLQAEIVFGWCPPEWLQETEKLRWMQLCSVGFGEYLHLDWHNLDQRIVFTNLAGFFTVPVSETVLAGILALYRGIDELTELKKCKTWKKLELRSKLQTLTRAKVLLVGYGTLGHRLHELLRAFNCEIITFDRFAKDAQLHTMPQVDAALPQVDIVAAALPDTDQTRGMFDKNRFALMKTGAIFVNVGRGSLVDETALIESINTRHLGGTVIDVTVDEPLRPDHPLWNCPRTIITQHTGGGSNDELDRMMSVFENNLYRYRQGLTLENIIDWKRGY